MVVPFYYKVITAFDSAVIIITFRYQGYVPVVFNNYI